MTFSRRARGACLGVVLAVLAVLGGVVISAAPRCPEHCRTEAAARDPQPAPSNDPAQVAITPADGATDVDPLGGITVVAHTGMLTGVTMVNDAGKSVPGVVTPDFKTWKPTVALGYGRTYTLSVEARGPGGVQSAVGVDLPDPGPEQPDRGVPDRPRRTAARRGHIRHRRCRRRPLRRNPSPIGPPPNAAYRSPRTHRCADRGTGSTTRTPTGDRKSTTPQALR